MRFVWFVAPFLATTVLLPHAAEAAELYGSVKLSFEFWQKKTSSRRLALPQQKIPLGYYVAVDGEPFKGQDFGKPQPDKSTLVFDQGGFSTAFSAVMLGGDIELDNRSDTALTVDIAGQALTVEAKSKKAVPADKVGEIRVKSGTAQSLVIVWPSPYIIDLDDTGEFAFEGLNDGDYKVTIFGLRNDGSSGVVHEQSAHLEGGRTTLLMQLGDTSAPVKTDAAKETDK